MILRGTYIKCVFFDAEIGQASFLVKPSDKIEQDKMLDNGLVKVVGRFCLQQKYMPLFLTGDWKNSEYGPEFAMYDACETALGEEEMTKFIAGLRTQLSRKEIKKILSVVNNDIFSILSIKDAEAQLQEKTGVDILSITDLTGKLKKLMNEMTLFKILDQNGGNYAHCKKILSKFQGESLAVLTTDPYQILEKVSLPFAVIDKFALNNGADAYSQQRIRAMLIWAMRRITNAGHVYFTLEELERLIKRTYGAVPVTAILSALTDHPYIMRDPDYDVYYEKTLYFDEAQGAKEYARLQQSRKPLPWHPEIIEKLEKDSGCTLGRQQKEAFLLLRSTGIKVLTGDPGTGKTTTVNLLLKYLEEIWKEVDPDNKPKISLCAPSGRASQRMKETTARNALTIHKTLDYQSYGGREMCKGANDPIDADIIVVDETSMMGLGLFTKLLKAIRSGSLVLFVGDINQIPSVEPGNVLHDLIRCGTEYCHLTEVYRQSEESLINQNAKKIISGDDNLQTGPDFSLIDCKSEEIDAVFRASVQEIIRLSGDKDKVQIISPIKKGTCGTKNTNRMIQEIFNPGQGGIWYGYNNYSLNDRIIMLSNNYSLNYYNGDIGKIVDVSDNHIQMECNGDILNIPRDQFSDLTLSYSITIHKSQGSEFDYLLILLPKESRGMLDQNLFYTAVTRAKKYVRIISEDGMYSAAISVRRQNKRKSLLCERIQKILHIKKEDR